MWISKNQPSTSQVFDAEKFNPVTLGHCVIISLRRDGWKIYDCDLEIVICKHTWVKKSSRVGNVIQSENNNHKINTSRTIKIKLWWLWWREDECIPRFASVENEIIQRGWKMQMRIEWSGPKVESSSDGTRSFLFNVNQRTLSNWSLVLSDSHPWTLLTISPLLVKQIHHYWLIAIEFHPSNKRYLLDRSQHSLRDRPCSNRHTRPTPSESFSVSSARKRLRKN